MTEPRETTEQVSSDERRRLLAEMLKKRATRVLDRPLSLGQERLWLMANLEPGGSRYNIAVAYRLVGRLDRSALERAIASIAERHEVLRATFPSGKGLTVARVSPDAPMVVSFTEIGELSAGKRERITREFIAIEEAKRPFDLATGPLWRVKLLEVSEEDHVLILVMHHIVSDAWSFYVLNQELAEAYDAILSGRTPHLSALPIQYAEFGQRQRQWLSGQVFDQQVAHWQAHLKGNVTRLLLPTDHALSAATSRRGALRTITIPEPLTQSLTELSRRETATMFMTLLAGFEVLLHQYSGQTDMVVCTPASGRHRSQTRELIGYFNNILPLRFDLGGAPTFVDVVRRTRRVALDAFKYQDLPFQTIAEFPNLKSVSLSRALFSLDIEWPPSLSLPGLQAEPWAVRTGTVDFDLSISLWLAGNEVRGVFEYRAELFDESTIERMISDYRELLSIMAQDPEIAVSALPKRDKREAEFRRVSKAADSIRYKLPKLPTDFRVIKECEEVLGKSPVNLDDDLFELGASSLAFARLAQRLKALFEVDFPLVAMFQARTVGRIAALARDQGSALVRSALVPIQPHGKLPPLFLCEGIGVYMELARYLDKEQPIYGLITELATDYPRVEDLATLYLKELKGVQPHGPYHIGGLSFGGMVAFELAQQLVAAGEEVALLILFDTPTPWAFTPKPLVPRLKGHLSNVRRFGWQYIQTKIRARLKSLQQVLPFANGRTTESTTQILADTDRVRFLLGTTAKKYHLRPYPGRITLIALSERGAMSDSLFDPAIVNVDPELGWGRIAQKGVELHEVTGEHTMIFREPHVRFLAERVGRCLDLARGAAAR